MKSFDEAFKKAKDNGHKFIYDPPHSLSSMNRYTCEKCGKAVLGNSTSGYGSATEDTCTI